MDMTAFSQTMDIDFDIEKNRSYQSTKVFSMYANHTFNFEDTELTFEFTRYIQQLCSDMEEAKNRLDGGDSVEIKELLNNLIDKVQQDISVIKNTTINNSINNSTANATQHETSALTLLADLFRENKDNTDPIENISKLNRLSRSLREVSANLSNKTLDQSINDKSILKSIKENENKENMTLENIQENAETSKIEASFVNKSVYGPLMELLNAVEKKVDVEQIEESIKAKYEKQLKTKEQDILNLENEIKVLVDKSRNYDEALEQIEFYKKENECLDEIISKEKSNLEEKQRTVEELNTKLSQNLFLINQIESTNIELKKEVTRLSLLEKENQSLNEQVDDLLIKVNKVFDLEKKITILNVESSQKQAMIDNLEFELKSLNERFKNEKNDLISKIENLTTEDAMKSNLIVDLKAEKTNLSAQLSLQKDKNDFVSAKMKDTLKLKKQLETDRKDICWQINDLLKNPDVDFEDLKTFLVLVEQKISNVDIKKPSGAAFVKSLIENAGNKNLE